MLQMIILTNNYVHNSVIYKYKCMCVYECVCVWVCVWVCVYIYVYIYMYIFNYMLSYIIISAKNKLNCFVRTDVFVSSSFGVHFDFFSFKFFFIVFSFPPLSILIILKKYACIYFTVL